MELQIQAASYKFQVEENLQLETCSLKQFRNLKFKGIYKG